MGPHPVLLVSFIKKNGGEANLDTHRGKAMYRDRGASHPSIRQKERPGKHRSFKILWRNQRHWHLDVLFSASRNLRINLCCLSHSVCCTLSWKPYQTNTPTMNVDKTIKKLTYHHYYKYLISNLGCWISHCGSTLILTALISFLYHHSGLT